MHAICKRTRRLALVLALAAGLGPALGCASSGGPPRSRPSAQSEPRKLTDAQRRARMHYELGVDRLGAGRNPEAIGELLQAMRFDPGDERVRVALAEAYRRGGRNAEAEEHLKAALQIDPASHQALLNLSALYIQTERYEPAIESAQRLLADPTFPNPWRALTNLGWAELQLGRAEAAQEHLALALDYRDSYWPARLNLGILEAERGNRDAAVAHFERVLVSQPGPFAEAEVRFRLAELYLSDGDRESAIQQLTKASDLRPSGPWGKRSAEYLASLQ